MRVASLVSAGLFCIWPANAGCRVEVERKLQTVTARFVFGTAAVSVTLPYVLYRSQAAVVYPQILGSDLPEGLFLASSGEKTPLKNSAALHFVPERNKRLAFSVTDASGQTLCDWAAPVGTSKYTRWISRTASAALA